MSDAESGGELAETDSQRPEHMPRLTASLGLKRGGLRAAEVSPPGLPWTCPPAPPVQGQPWSPVPPCGGAGNRLPQPHLGTPSASGPTPLADRHRPSLLSLPTHFLSLFTFSAFLFLLCPQCVHICTHTFITSARVWAGRDNKGVCQHACSLVCTCHLCC